MMGASRCVFVANGQIHAEQVRSLLASAGIPSALRGEALSKTHGLTLDGLGRVDVLVSPADEDRARAMLAAAESGEFALPEDSVPEA
jgi:Putative prokaryotic signal transducing protein